MTVLTFPLDLQATPYSYIERANRVLVSLVEGCLAETAGRPRILDVGCGCGANARALRTAHPDLTITGIEPNPRAAELAAEACTSVHRGDLDSWLALPTHQPFDVVVLSDVLEHVADPVAFLRQLSAHESVRRANWVISVPNYAVWYNRLRTVAGVFEYAWSGLYDRTHLRFYTRRSLRRLLEELGFEVTKDSCSPSVVQSTAPLLRRLFEKDVREGNHLSLGDSKAYRFYQRAVEPAEAAFCQTWPELLGFQIIVVARLAS
jgi:2-polyprenyl-3-methyl-5-hydroxy-6-metoxy-1,4-benzoquinol methylase